MAALNFAKGSASAAQERRNTNPSPKSCMIDAGIKFLLYKVLRVVE
jgi:hypothetical protein